METLTIPTKISSALIRYANQVTTWDREKPLNINTNGEIIFDSYEHSLVKITLPSTTTKSQAWKRSNIPTSIGTPTPDELLGYGFIAIDEENKIYRANNIAHDVEETNAFLSMGNTAEGTHTLSITAQLRKLFKALVSHSEKKTDPCILNAIGVERGTKGLQFMATDRYRILNLIAPTGSMAGDTNPLCNRTFYGIPRAFFTLASHACAKTLEVGEGGAVLTLDTPQGVVTIEQTYLDSTYPQVDRLFRSKSDGAVAVDLGKLKELYAQLPGRLKASHFIEYADDSGDAVLGDYDVSTVENRVLVETSGVFSVNKLECHRRFSARFFKQAVLDMAPIVGDGVVSVAYDGRNAARPAMVEFSGDFLGDGWELQGLLMPIRMD